jgi:hypothetical protein
MSVKIPPRGPGTGRVTLGLVAALTLLIKQTSAAIIHVQASQMIQPVINSAVPGDIIKVGPGIYPEQLLIKGIDRISLIGNKAILKPPATVDVNSCSVLTSPPKPVGICINGATLQTPITGEHNSAILTGEQIKNIVVSGFTVSGFEGMNIAVAGARDTTISNNILLDGGVFGLLSISSTNTMATGNIITSSVLGTTGMGMADAGASSFLKNNITGYATGVRVETSSGIVKDSHIKNSCMGITINPAVAGAVISTNHIKDVNPVCSLPANTGNPAGGILVNGAIKSNVKGNVAYDLHRGTDAAGITLMDSTTPASVASENRFTLNFLFNNDVAIKRDTTGTGNTFI